LAQDQGQAPSRRTALSRAASARVMWFRDAPGVCACVCVSLCTTVRARACPRALTVRWGARCLTAHSATPSPGVGDRLFKEL
jgi:hypothetical protein